MTVYLSLPAFQELIEFVENNSMYEDWVKPMVNSELTYHFPVVVKNLEIPVGGLSCDQ